MQTKHDISLTFRDLHNIRIPAGTPVKWIKRGMGGYAVEPQCVELLSKTDSLFKHDSTYFYIWIDRAHVEGR